MQPIMSILMIVMAMLGGIFIPIDTMPGWMLDIAHVLPSYWLGQVGRGAVTSDLVSGSARRCSCWAAGPWYSRSR